MDAKIHVIRDGKPGDIVSQYVAFTKITDDQIRKYGRTKETAEEIVRMCLERNILTEYLEERKGDVMDIMTTLFDQETVLKNMIKREKRETQLEEIISSVEEGDYSIERGAKKAGLSVEELRSKALILFNKNI